MNCKTAYIDVMNSSDEQSRLDHREVPTLWRVSTLENTANHTSKPLIFLLIALISEFAQIFWN